MNGSEVTLQQFWSISSPEGHDFYLEGNRIRELDYSSQHFRRMMELYRMIQGLGLSTGNLLDIGTNPFTFFLHARTSFTVHTIDYSPSFANRCAREGVPFLEHDLTGEGLPFPEGYFDVIVFTEVFEHLVADPVRILSKLRRMLKPRGYLIFGTPNLASLQKRLLLLVNRPILDRPTWDLTPENIHGHGHNRIYLLAEIEQYMEAAGLRLVEKRYSCAMDLPHRFDSRFEKIGKTLLLPAKLVVPSFRWGIHAVAQA